MELRHNTSRTIPLVLVVAEDFIIHLIFIYWIDCMSGNVTLALGICTNIILLGVEILNYFPTSFLIAIVLSLSFFLPKSTVLIPGKS